MKLKTMLEVILDCLCRYKSIMLIILASAFFFFNRSAIAHINIKKIWSDYFSKMIKGHNLVCAFIISPICLGLAISSAKYVTGDIINYIITTVSILVSMFFAYIAFYDGFHTDNSVDASSRHILSQVVLESRIIVSFEIFLCVLLLIICIIFPIIENACDLALEIYSTVIFAIFINLIENLLMLLKKYAVLSQNTSNKQ